MDEVKKYNDEDMVIPLYYKGSIIGHAPDDFNAKVFKFIDEEQGPKIWGESAITLVSFHKEDDKTKMSHWYALDEHDVELFRTGKAMWSGDINNG